MARDHGDVVYFRVGSREVFLVSQPVLIDRILREHYAHFEKDWGPRRGASAFGNGILTSERGDHRVQRQELSTLFARGAIESRRPEIAAMVDRWSSRQRDGARVDLFDEMSELGTEIAMRILFGCSIDRRRLVHAGRPVEQAFRRWMFPWADRLRIRRDRGLRMRSIVEEIRTRRAQPDATDALLDPVMGSDDQVVTFIIVSQETLRIATTCAWFLLSANPESRQRLVAEARGAGADRRTPFAEAVLLESMRLYPPQWMIGRRAITPYAIDGYEIPPGALVLMSPYIVHRDARLFDQPERFIPERWMGGTQPQRGAYFPFGAGPRRCIGESLAMAAGTMMLSSIARDWVFDCEGSGIRFDPRMTLQIRSMPARVRAVSAPLRG